MHTPASSPQFVTLELASWCGLARDALQKTLLSPQSGEVLVLKRHLADQHSIHRKQLVRCTHHYKKDRSPHLQSKVWIELVEALGASDDYVALAACALLERMVLAAYEKAADHITLENSIVDLIRRQKIEVRSFQDHFPRRMQGWRYRGIQRTATAPHGTMRKRSFPSPGLPFQVFPKTRTSPFPTALHLA